ncbi:hypothetical protein [Porphyromonas vaginalis]|nr:hypothetical protein [Porphyromonas vaginalis]
MVDPPGLQCRSEELQSPDQMAPDKEEASVRSWKQRGCVNSPFVV